MSNRVRIIRHKGAHIIHIDWSHAKSPEIRAAMEAAKHLISQQPPATALTLTNVNGAIMDRAVTEALRDYVAHNKPYVRAGAVVGLNDLKMIAFNFVNRVTSRALRAMETEEEARDWLAALEP